MEKIINKSMQTNKNIENFKKNYCWYKRPTEKNKWKPTMENRKSSPKISRKNQQKLVSIEENFEEWH